MSRNGDGAVRSDVRSTCRGGWRRALLATLLGLALGGGAGCSLSPPIHRSEADLFFDTPAPSIADALGDSAPPFEKLQIEAHATLIRSERVVSLALESDNWRELGRVLSLEDLAELRERIEVTRAQGDHIVKISCTDGDPLAARVLVQELITAYQSLAVEFFSAPYRVVLTSLREERLLVATELDDLRGTIAAAVSNWGGEQALLGLHIAYMSRTTDLDFRCREIEDRLRLLREELKEAEESDADPGGLLDVDEILAAELLIARKALESAKAKAKEFAEAWSELERLQERRDALRARLQGLREAEEILKERMAAAGRVMVLTASGSGPRRKVPE